MFPFIVTKKDVLASDTNAYHYTADASDLRLPPCLFPERLETSLGNKLPFCLISRNADKAEYFQANGCISLTVFND